MPQCSTEVQYELHPEGWFVFTVADAKFVRKMWPDGEAEQFEWRLDSTEKRTKGDKKGELFSKKLWTSLNLSDRGQFRKFLAALGADPDDAYWKEPFDESDSAVAEFLDPCFGRQLYAEIVHEKKKDGTLQDKFANYGRVPKELRGTRKPKPADDEE